METGEIQKWTVYAYAFVKQDSRSFYKIDGLYLIKINGKKYPYNYNPINSNDKPDEKNLLDIVFKIEFKISLKFYFVSYNAKNNILSLLHSKIAVF